MLKDKEPFEGICRSHNISYGRIHGLNERNFGYRNNSVSKIPLIQSMDMNIYIFKYDVLYNSVHIHNTHTQLYPCIHSPHTHMKYSIVCNNC